MQINCEQCKSRFNIPDEKIPEGKVSSLRCPKCKNTLTIDTTKPESVASRVGLETEEPEPETEQEGYEEDYDASDKPFDFIEEEEKTALVCEPDAIIREQIINVLDMLEFHITVCDNAREALKNMRYHIYDLVVLNEDFDAPDPDANGILIYLERLNMSVRREIFVFLISTRHQTMDRMISFNRSVNLVMNPKDISDFEKILKRGLSELTMAYRVYRDTLKKLGRI
jgi:predicted Zn finger-like uncharacterized protein